MQFEIPPFLKAKIAEDPEVSSVIGHALNVLFPWFLDNKLFFFPEFTDHGVDHINTVLSTAESLISTEAKMIFSSRDAGATISAVLLHDCAMHLSWEGFQTLLTGEYVAASPLLPSDLPSWPEVFRSFMHQALRWDQRKLLEVVGTTAPIRHPPNNLIETNEVDKRVIGEFVRIHHARIAHEISLLGVPGPIEKRDTWIRPVAVSGTALPADLIGFIARSHNLSIRRAKDLLPTHRRREFNGIHAPFVMSLLRISDYLQIQSKRAHPSLLSIRRVSSTISIAEWKKHAATVDIHPHGDDPEALVVHTEPADTSTLFALRSLFSSMQQELDETWACLGEVYGRHPALQSFAFNGLGVRRLQTNIDDLKLFEAEARPGFIPIELRLKSAGADMFGLLVNPLYDSEPTVAIRELVQNSVDACNERAAVEASLSESVTLNTVKVVLFIESDERGYLEVQDNGIGMTLQTIRDYYLVAGASFRKSGWWKEHFQGDDGKSHIRRSGRFGVGALASFLVGARTHVITRHLEDRTGLGVAFSFGIDDGFIEAKLIPAEIGTTIRIDINSAEILKKLKGCHDEYSNGSNNGHLHWYALDEPKVTIKINTASKKREITKTFSLPMPGSELPKNWNVFTHEKFKTIHWSFENLKTKVYESSTNWLLCNGILIANGWHVLKQTSISISPTSPVINLKRPTISVFDPDGYLPLNLARNGLADGALPFEKELVTSMADWFTRSTHAAWKKAESFEDAVRNVETIAGLVVSQATYQSSMHGVFVHTANSVCLLDASLLKQASLDRVILIPRRQVQTNRNRVDAYLASGNIGLIHTSSDFGTKGGIEASLNTILRSDTLDRNFLSNLGRNVQGIRVVCSKSFYTTAREKSRLPKYVFSDWAITELPGDRKSLTFGVWPDLESKDNSDFLDLVTEDSIYAEVVFGDQVTDVPTTPLSRSWAAAGYQQPFLSKPNAVPRTT